MIRPFFTAVRRSTRPLTVERLETRDVPSGTWTALANRMPTGAGGAQQMMLLSDGSVMIQGGSDDASNLWYRLTPNSSGSYVNGTISQLASMGTPRLFFASNVLPTGKVMVLGGEYTTSASATYTNTGEIYDPVANTWSAMADFPRTAFGDDPTEMLPDGRVLAGYISGPQTYVYNPAANTWAQTGTKLRSDRSDEETWVLLPGGGVLSYDVFASPGSGAGHAQKYNPTTGAWTDAGSVPVPMSSSSLGDEFGPGLLLPDGRVFMVGANGNTALYSPATNSWAAGPVTPNGLGADDAPGAMLPNGHVLYAADTVSPNFTQPTVLFEYDPVANTVTQETTSNTTFASTLTTALSSRGAFLFRMLSLPNGHVLMSASTSTRLWEYTPTGGPADDWRPTISSVAFTGGLTYTLTGTQLNGLSEGASYGDDAEMSSNYPIVRLTSSNGTVYYARTFNWSNTGVATGSAPVTTQFALPAPLPFGTYSLTVIANGIASTPVNFTPPVYADTRWAGLANGAAVGDADPVVAGNQPATIGTNAFATVTAAIAAAPAGGTLVVNGDDGTHTLGNFTEAVSVDKAVMLYLQRGAVAFGSLAGNAPGANVLLNAVPLMVGTNGSSTEYDGTINGTGSLTKAGGGTLTLDAINTYSGGTTVAGGGLVVDGALPVTGAVTVAAGATLGGAGTVGTTNVDGTLAAGTGGMFTTGGLTFTSAGSLSVAVNGPAAGTQYSQVTAGGTVNLAGATLAVTVGNGFAPAVGATFTVLVNHSGGAIVGTFAGLSEGATISAGGQLFAVSYLGGGGHDVVLTRVVPPTVAAVQVDDGSAQRSEVRSLSVTFSSAVTFANNDPAAAFTLTRVTGGTVGLVAGPPTPDAQGRTVVTLTFSGTTATDPLSAQNGGVLSLDDGRYQLSILDGAVSGVNGLALDGDGDGTPGGAYQSPQDTVAGGPGQLRLYRLFGDATGDGGVDLLDLGALRATFNADAGSSSYLGYLDADNSGAVDLSDLGQFRTRFNSNVF